MNFTSFLIGRATKKQKMASLESYDFGFKIGALSEKNIHTASKSKKKGLIIGNAGRRGLIAFTSRKAAGAGIWNGRIREIANYIAMQTIGISYLPIEAYLKNQAGHGLKKAEKERVDNKLKEFYTKIKTQHINATDHRKKETIFKMNKKGNFIEDKNGNPVIINASALNERLKDYYTNKDFTTFDSKYLFYNPTDIKIDTKKVSALYERGKEVIKDKSSLLTEPYSFEPFTPAIPLYDAKTLDPMSILTYRGNKKKSKTRS